ncbi:unnamed protein product, partial [Mesorhabditis spiculigera]
MDYGYNSAGFQAVIEAHPCIANVGDVPTLCAIVGDSVYTFLICVAIVSAINFSLILFPVLHSIYILYEKRSQMSDKTRRLQRSFFLSILLQMAIPFTSLAVPWVYFIAAALIDFEPLVLWNDLLFTGFCSHGFLNSISVILIYRPKSWGEYMGQVLPVHPAELSTAAEKVEKMKRLKMDYGYYSDGFQATIQKHPCVGNVDADDPTLCAIVGDSVYTFLICVGIVSIVNLNLFVLPVAHSIFILYSKRSQMSVKTRKLQRSFFFSILLQVALPFVFLAAPWMYFMIAAIIDFEPLILWNNLLFTGFCSHGLFNSWAVIIIHRPYREELFLILFRRTLDEYLGRGMRVHPAELSTAAEKAEKIKRIKLALKMVAPKQNQVPVVLGLAFDALVQSYAPEMFFPATAGRMLGPWYWIFGLGVKSGLVCAAVFYAFALEAIVQSSRSSISAFYPLVALGILAMYQPVLDCGYYTVGVQQLIEKYPCLALVYEKPDICAIAPGDSAGVSWILVGTVSVINCSLCGVFAFHSSYLLFGTRTNVSTKTKKLQQAFFLSLLVQLLISFFSLAATPIWFLFVTVVGLRPALVFNQVLLGAFCSHGLLNSLSVIFIYRPYRNCDYGVPTAYATYGGILPYVSYPMAAFALYLIIWRSPDFMKDYRIHLVILQCCSIIYELVLLMMVMEVWFPAWGARFHGPWGGHFSCRYSLLAGTIVTGLVNEAIVQILSFKHQQLLPHKSRFRVRKRTWVILLVIFYIQQQAALGYAAGGIPLYDGYDTPAMQNIFSQYPCLSLVGDVSGLCAPEEDAPIRVCAYAVLYIIASNTILLFIQLIAMGAPWIWVMGSTLAGLGLHLTLNHVLFGIFLSHGLINSLTTIFIIKPYRLEKKLGRRHVTKILYDSSIGNDNNAVESSEKSIDSAAECWHGN